MRYYFDECPHVSVMLLLELSAAQLYQDQSSTRQSLIQIMLDAIGVMKVTGLTFMFVLVLHIGKTKSDTKWFTNKDRDDDHISKLYWPDCEIFRRVFDECGNEVD